ncbi:MAG: Cof-type HAD-IIB family hydrolase [Christensenellales bacterium]|jgi:Cof subfamily protein (haloacid dehalogenase superfamily)
MYRMIATDVDGTLVDSRNTLTERTANAIRAAEEAGVKIVIASARPYGSIEGLLSRLALKDPYVIAGSGTSIWQSAANKEKIHLSLSAEQVRECARFASRYGYGCLAVKHDGSFYYAPGMGCADYYGGIFKTPSYPVDYETENCTDCCKIMLFTEVDADDIALCLERVKGELSHFSFSKTWRNIVEVYPAGVCKENAMAEIAKMLSIPLAEVIALGDDRVDMGMIRMAGLGVAMENGDGDLKAAADFVTLSNDEDGVAHVIEKFILNA